MSVDKEAIEVSTASAVDRADSPKSSTVGRVLAILDLVASSDRALSPTEMAAELDIPKASLHRLCASLEEEGYLQPRLNQRGLQPGYRLHNMALGVLASGPLQAQRRAILSSLSAEIGETCNIAVPDGAEMIYFDRAETHWPVRVQLQIGSRVPVCATAGGKMYLSTLTKTKRDRIVRNSPLIGYTRNTIVNPDTLLNELDEIALRGYALDNEEYIDGMVALAVPIKDEKNRLYATLSFHAPCMRISFSNVTQFLPAVRKASEQLSTLLKD